MSTDGQGTNENGVEILPKISTRRVGRTIERYRQTERRTDGPAIAYSERSVKRKRS